MTADDPRWLALATYGDAYTCYSAAVASWTALADEEWRSTVDNGFELTLTEAPDGLFGFVHFRAGLRDRLGLVRRASSDPSAAEDMLDELGRSGRVIVAGDGFSLPWHVAHGRRHVPHWFVLAGTPESPVVVDPFSARNDLGLQEAVLQRVDPSALGELARSDLAADEVVMLREAYALGDDARPVPRDPFQWFVHEPEQVGSLPAPSGPQGPDALRRLAQHFRESGDHAGAYRQADDIWSIARHRAFLARHARELGADEWVVEHLEPLAKRWSHMAPLLMQAVLAIGAGRKPTGSVAATLDELADREAAASAS